MGDFLNEQHRANRTTRRMGTGGMKNRNCIRHGMYDVYGVRPAAVTKDQSTRGRT